MPHPKSIRYSIPFKKKVVQEIESGKFHSYAHACRTYGIKGNFTLQRWLKQYGSSSEDLSPTRIVMKSDKDEVKKLAKEKQALESALAQAHLKILMLESAIEVEGIKLKKVKKKDASNT